MMLSLLDLFGTFIFAVSGAFRAVKYELDILGVYVLALVTGIGGGIIRDLLIGAVPPAALMNESYFLVCIAGGLLVFLAAPHIARIWNVFLVCDALGLGVFTAVGALKGLHAGLGVAGVMLTGTLTAIGGGMIRDILVREIPLVLHRDIYATAALLGSLFLYIASRLGMPDRWILWTVIILTTGSRLLAMRFRFRLPRVKSLPEAPSRIQEKLSAEKREKKHKRPPEDPSVRS